jgi:hypothetical protein
LYNVLDVSLINYRLAAYLKDKAREMEISFPGPSYLHGNGILPEVLVIGRYSLEFRSKQCDLPFGNTSDDKYSPAIESWVIANATVSWRYLQIRFKQLVIIGLLQSESGGGVELQKAAVLIKVDYCRDVAFFR